MSRSTVPPRGGRSSGEMSIDRTPARPRKPPHEMSTAERLADIERKFGKEGLQELKNLGWGINDALAVYDLRTEKDVQAYLEGPGIGTRIWEGIKGIPGKMLSAIPTSIVAGLTVPLVGKALSAINPNLTPPGSPTPLPEATVQRINTQLARLGDGQTVASLSNSPSATQAFMNTAMTVGGLSLGAQTLIGSFGPAITNNEKQARITYRRALLQRLRPDLMATRQIAARGNAAAADDDDEEVVAPRTPIARGRGGRGNQPTANT